MLEGREMQFESARLGGKNTLFLRNQILWAISAWSSPLASLVHLSIMFSNMSAKELPWSVLFWIVLPNPIKYVSSFHHPYYITNTKSLEQYLARVRRFSFVGRILLQALHVNILTGLGTFISPNYLPECCCSYMIFVTPLYTVPFVYLFPYDMHYEL
jgi:hypothetical protein